MNAKKAPQHDLSEHERELRSMELEAQVYEYKAKYYEALAACTRSQLERERANEDRNPVGDCLNQLFEVA